ncbi:MAG: hypothetical protein K2O47_04805 [Muribaculaceae bacterium]|nr:hypothetical protein [Muribaculaceae bacterium]
MIWIEIIIVIGLVILLVAMIRDKKKHPEDYKTTLNTPHRHRSGGSNIRMSNPRMRQYYQERSRYKS